MSASTLPEDLSSQLVFMPYAKEGPRFFVPEKAVADMRPYLAGLKQAHPHVVVLAGVTLGATKGMMFGPEDDRALEDLVIQRFGVKDPRGPNLDDTSRQTPAPDLGHQPQLQRPEGRGRPPKYPFRQMTQVGDHFLAVGATRPKMQATGCNFLTKSALNGVYEFAYHRVERGVLVVVTKAPGDRSRYEADGTSDGD